jgi:hypothetical protein|nr:MAG TPA: hypothetical protein [Caudoviricetes sp.]
MLKKTITYMDCNDVERTEDFYFNLSKAEVIEMELTTTGGMTKVIDKIISTQDTPALFRIFKDLILKSYGEKSLDGKRFIKSEELSEAFSQTEAYSELLTELVSDADKASEFVNAIIPKVDGKQAKALPNN